MRLTLSFIGEGETEFPIYYNELIQGFIYRNIDRNLARFFHDKGLRCGKRVFRFFTFSRIFGKAKLENNRIKFSSPFKLVISSYFNEFLQSLAENLIKMEEVKIGNNILRLESIHVNFTPKIENEAKIKMLSPVTVYSTLTTPDRRKKTYFYNPKEREFPELIKENIIKKYFALFNKKPPSDEFLIEPLKVTKADEKIVIYKGFIIKGWMGKYKLKGEPELLKLAYDVGIGSKNSQGFGCFEVEGENTIDFEQFLDYKKR